MPQLHLNCILGASTVELVLYIENNIWSFAADADK